MRSIRIKIAYILAWLIGDRQRKNKVKIKLIAAFLLGIGCGLTAEPLLASEITGSQTTNTQVQPSTEDSTQIDISGGEIVDANLFHQFDKFDLSESNTARFLTDSKIQNIIGHITSGQLSTIDGTLEAIDSQTFGSTEANLYILNPAGILFGSNIQLNILGDFTATTASAIEFNEAILDLSTSSLSTDYSKLSGDPTGFIFNGSGPIANLGVLQAAPEKVISLMGSTLLNLGDISAPDGGIRLLAIEDNTIVRINQDNQLLALDISVGQLENATPRTAAELLTGKNTEIVQHLISDENGIRLVQDTGVDIAIPGNSNSIINTGNLSVTSEVAEGGTIDLFGTQIGILDGNIDASGQEGGIVRVGSEYSKERTTSAIYIDSQASLAARAELNNSNSASETREGGQIIFREAHTSPNSDRFSLSEYINHIYGNLDVRSLAPEGEGGQIVVRGAGKETTYQANMLSADSPSQTGNITFEAFNVGISNLPSVIYSAQSLFSDAAEINPGNHSLALSLPQSTVQSFSNLTIESRRDILIKDLADNKLVFPERSTVRFFSDRDNTDGGTVKMQDSGQTIVAPLGTVELQSGRTGGLLIRNIDTNLSSKPDIGRGHVRLISNQIELVGGEQGDGRQSIGTRTLLVNSADSQGSRDREGIWIGDSDDISFRPNLLRLDNNITDVLRAGTMQLKLGSQQTGDILFSETSLPFFQNSIKLRSGSNIEFRGLISASNEADLDVIANGDITTKDIYASGSVTLESREGDITTDLIRLIPSTSETVGDVSLNSHRGNIEAQSIQSWGSSQNAGGNISLIAADGNLSIGDVDGQSIRTDSGQITIIHGNKDSLFSVGDRTENGTSGAIISADSSLSNVDILGNYGEGDGLSISSPFKVSVSEEASKGESVENRPVAVGETIAVTDTPQATTILSRTLESTSKIEELENPFRIPVERHSESTAASALFHQLESKDTDRFQAYLSLSKPTGIATIDEVQSTLKQVGQASQQAPGLIYLYYTPNAEHEESVRPLVSQQNRPDDELEILLVTSEGVPIRRRQWGITRAQVDEVASEFRRQVTSQFSMPRDYLPPAQQLYRWMLAPIQKELDEHQIDSLAFIMDDGLRTVPIAALHDGQRFLIEDYSLGLMPTFSLTEVDIESKSGRNTPQVLAMGASRFKEQAPLPAVESELNLISKDLWLGDAFINEDFTLNNLKSQLISHPYDILHLATHAVFTSGDMDQSYIQLWDDQLKLSDVDTLGLSQSEIELIILSACSTALGDRNSEYGFAGLAVNAGSQSALASLWPVSDEGTLGFMTQFYEYLPKAELRAEALRSAQLNMLQGKVGIDRGQLYGPNEERITSIPAIAESGSWAFSHPFYWSAFTIVGSPW